MGCSTAEEAAADSAKAADPAAAAADDAKADVQYAVVGNGPFVTFVDQVGSSL